MPAWELYDGGAYRVARRLEREMGRPLDDAVLILSAEYGLVEPQDSLTPYDRRMDRARAKEIGPVVRLSLSRTVEDLRPSEIYIAASGAYVEALSPIEDWSGGVPTRIGRGRIGEQLAQLKAWLRYARAA